MTTFEMPVTDGTPLDIVDFKVNLLSSPPEIDERIIDTVDPYVSSYPEGIKICYKDAPTDEGRLNICICRFRTGKYRLHIFGKIKGQVLRTEKEISDASLSNLTLLNEKIKYVLLSSRNILKNYYLHSNLKSMEDHLIAFLLPL
ncbi:MAG: hypothetical protein K0S12_1493 [Bacteroidetes bacterium]|jgi:hypothetical protein|nr:hypothetical protein [Bacteroidota bacterium]